MLIIGLCACGNDSGTNPTNNDPGGTDDPGDTTDGNNSVIISDVFISNDMATLDSAEVRFDELVRTSSADQARQKLVTELSAQSNVAGATLFEDGYTIMVKFDNGTYGAINTLDYDVLNESVTEFTGPPAIDRRVLSKISAQKASGAMSEVVFDNIPSHKQVLVLNISQPDLPGNSTAATWIHWLFQQAGWKPNDITVKTRGSRTATSITPEDFFELDDYGMVFIFAHGMYGRFGEDDPTRYYLQLGTANSYGSTYAAELREAALSGQIVVCDGDFYMRMDLLQNVLNTPEHGMVFLIGSQGSTASGTFLKDMYGRFFGWEGVPKAVDSYGTLKQLIQAMTASKPAISDAEAYFDETLDITSSDPDGRTAIFRMIPQTGDMYMPAWAVLSILNTSVPADAIRFDAGVQIDNKTVTIDDLAGMSGTIDMIVPGVSNSFARAYDADDEYVMATTQPDTIVVGENIIQLNFNKQTVYGVYKREDVPNDNKFAPMSAICYAAHIWKKLGEERYYVTHTQDGYELEYVEPLNVDNLSLGRGGYCYNANQIIQMQGSLPFPMEDDELARIEIIEYKYDPNDSEDVERVNGYWESIIDYCENKPWEVFPN